MIDEAIKKLTELTVELPELLKGISEMKFSIKPSPEKWSKKEILGHLIDSAANNHQRFIRVQFEEESAIRYNQNQWNALSHYNQKNTEELIRFWTSYNRHLIHIIQHIPEKNLERKCDTGEPSGPVTLQWLINDYVQHMEHHLHQMVEYT